MCGIAGIIQPHPVADEHTLKKMTAALAHRGPDGEGHWQSADGSVLLGHRRLAILDLSAAAAQPMQYRLPNDPLHRYTIVHNGEVYNYIELKKTLQNEGYIFTTQSDTEVILAAYDYWGEDCVEYFDGMFAFAIWDEVGQELFAARDRFGEKPFFYCRHNGAFYFASEMKAFWAAGITRIPNLKMLFNFMTIGYTANPENPGETFFDNIYKLPAASKLFFAKEKQELTITTYWELDAGARDTRITLPEATEKFLHLLQGSVRRRLRSDVPIGTSLSGGLDSSTIAALYAEIGHTSSYKVFTAGFPGFAKDETAEAEQFAATMGLQQQVITITGDDLLKDWDQFCYHQEEPVSSASAFAQYKVFERARRENVKVLLDGQGADEILAGYPKYYKWYWQELFQKRKLVRSKEIAAARKLGVTEKFGIKNIVAALFPELASVVLERRYLFNALKQEDLTPEFVQLQSKEAYYTTPAVHELNEYLHFNTCIYGLEELLRYADRNAMAHGRELRLPFLSHELVEFVFSLPPGFKIKQGWTKWLLRHAIQDQLPASVVWRKDKIGFEPPQQQWMENKMIQEKIRAAKAKLVQEKILQQKVLDKKIIPAGAYQADNYDWRYFSAAAFL